MWRLLGSRCRSEPGLDGGFTSQPDLWAAVALWRGVGRVCPRRLSCQQCPEREDVPGPVLGIHPRASLLSSLSSILQGLNPLS